SGNFHIGNKDSKTDMILIKDGDLVISGINVAKGAMGIYSGENVTATIHYSSYTFDSNKINVEYFKRFLKSSEFIELLNEQVKGGIKTEIKPKHILPLEIQLPDINTQAQIVQHFENVEDDINHVAQEVLTQQSLVKQLKQTILQEAIEGKLTAKWRTKNPEFDISKDFYELNSKAIKKPFEIPETWTWIKLDDLVNQKRGITYGIVKMGKEPTSDGVYALRCSDVKFRVIEIDNARKVTKEVSNQYKRTILHGGEILLNIRGTLGGCGIADDSLKGFNIAREIGLIPLENSGFTEYVFNVLTSPYFNTQIQNNLRGIAYKGLNLNLLRNFPIPLPPIEEQKEIVATIEKLFALCDELESEINQNKTTVDNLMATVLKEAFKQ
ncbi:MAG: restriction endonuclease subunit, partial [Campylobacterota bacterium]|nr:restriction endonuclease subunit [Campylobacterota bacterium]